MNFGIQMTEILQFDISIKSSWDNLFENLCTVVNIRMHAKTLIKGKGWIKDYIKDLYLIHI